MPKGPERRTESQVDSPYAWFRLAIAVTVATIGGVGLWSIQVILPVVQAEFGVARGGASLPYTMTMVGLVFGSLIMGKLSDRFGIVPPVVAGASGAGHRVRRRILRRPACGRSRRSTAW